MRRNRPASCKNTKVISIRFFGSDVWTGKPNNTRVFIQLHGWEFFVYRKHWQRDCRNGTEGREHRTRNALTGLIIARTAANVAHTNIILLQEMPSLFIFGLRAAQVLTPSVFSYSVDLLPSLFCQSCHCRYIHPLLQLRRYLASVLGTGH